MIALIVIIIIYISSAVFYYQQTRRYYKNWKFIDPEPSDVIILFIPIVNALCALLLLFENMRWMDTRKFFRLRRSK